MSSRKRGFLILALSVLATTLASAALAGAAAASPAPTGGFLDPKDDMFELPSYVSLTVTGPADRVRIRAHGVSAFGRYFPHSSNTIRPGKVWDFGKRRVDRTPRMKRMLDRVFHEYNRFAVVNLRVRVYTGTHFTNWRCSLTERTADSSCAPA